MLHLTKKPSSFLLFIVHEHQKIITNTNKTNTNIMEKKIKEKVEIRLYSLCCFRTLKEDGY